MVFWDTVKGHALADTLIRCLPALAERKTQYLVEASTEELKKIIETQIKEGSVLVQAIPVNDKYLCVFNKEEI